MSTIDLKEEVRKAVGREWPGFAAAHPRLAEVLDETLVIEGAAASLADDEEYQEAMRQAEVVGTAAETITQLVQKLVGQWLRQLL